MYLTLKEKPITLDRKSVLSFLRENYALILMGLNLLLALFLRLYNLTDNPVALNQDEAVNGVDAYAIAHTLRDHHGNFLPPMLESFEDWSSPALTYLTVPFVWLLGLSEFSIRLPVALAGVASVGLMYLVTKHLTGRKDLALLASFFLCIMPWHIMSSRWAIPPSSVTFFLLLTLYVYCRVTEAKPQIWKFAGLGLCAAVLTYSYPTQKMFVPMLLGIFFLADIIRKTAWKPLIQKYLAIGLPFLTLVSPIYYLTLSNPAKYNFRFNDVSIFSLKNTNLVWEFFARYFSYFEYNFNFAEGVIAYPFLALFYYPGIILCVYALFAKKEFIIPKPTALILLGWLFIFPVAASLTIDYYHILRTMHGRLLLALFPVVAIGGLLKLIKNRVYLLTLYAVLLMVSAYFLIGFSATYFIKYPEVTGQAFQYGIKGYSEYLLENEAKFSSVTIDSRINMPYIYYLFYSAKDPAQYNYAEINTRIPAVDNWSTVPKLDKYTFATITPEELTNAIEIYAVKDQYNFTWYKIYAIDRSWFVVRQY